MVCYQKVINSKIIEIFTLVCHCSLWSIIGRDLKFLYSMKINMYEWKLYIKKHISYLCTMVAIITNNNKNTIFKNILKNKWVDCTIDDVVPEI